MSMFYDMAAQGPLEQGGRPRPEFPRRRRHFCGVYECSCGNFISIGSIEPQFYALLRKHADLTDADFDAQMDRKLGRR